MRKLMLVLLLVSLVSLTPTTASAKGGCSVTVAQYGFATSSVESGNYFTLNGEGFRTWSPAWICLTGQLCFRTDVASDGTFSTTQELAGKGTYKIEVYQLKSRTSDIGVLVYTGSFTVN